MSLRSSRSGVARVGSLQGCWRWNCFSTHLWCFYPDNRSEALMLCSFRGALAAPYADGRWNTLMPPAKLHPSIIWEGCDSSTQGILLVGLSLVLYIYIYVLKILKFKNECASLGSLTEVSDADCSARRFVFSIRVMY